jgi:hypothetical protein
VVALTFLDDALQSLQIPPLRGLPSVRLAIAGLLSVEER